MKFLFVSTVLVQSSVFKAGLEHVQLVFYDLITIQKHINQNHVVYKVFVVFFKILRVIFHHQHTCSLPRP